jgi:lysophospholipase L1-like esterase
VVVAALAMLAAACTATPAREVPPPAPTGPAVVYVAVGASETTGVGSDVPLRDAWPRVLYRTALPETAVFVNMGIPGATVAQALAEELPYALQLRPTLVTVWLNVNDMIAGVSADDYEQQLDTLVKGLRRDGATRVLVANAPPLDRLPAYLAGRDIGRLPGPGVVNELVDAYNAAAARVADREGATLVDLYALGMAARANGTEASLVAADGFHPSTAGYAAVAGAFADVLRRTGPLVAAGS